MSKTFQERAQAISRDVDVQDTSATAPAKTEAVGETPSVPSESTTAQGEREGPAPSAVAHSTACVPGATTALQLTYAAPEAVKAMLDLAYGADAESYKPSSDEVNRDVLRLAAEFDVPCLKELAAAWLCTELNSKNAVHRLATCKEFDLKSTYLGIIEELEATPSAVRAVADDIDIVLHPQLLQDLLGRMARREFDRANARAAIRATDDTAATGMSVADKPEAEKDAMEAKRRADFEKKAENLDMKSFREEAAAEEARLKAELEAEKEAREAKRRADFVQKAENLDIERFRKEAAVEEARLIAELEAELRAEARMQKRLHATARGDVADEQPAGKRSKGRATLPGHVEPVMTRSRALAASADVPAATVLRGASAGA